MIISEIRRDPNGVPWIGRADIEQLAELILSEAQPSMLIAPEAFDVERFVELKLGLNIDFPYLSHKAIYLGMTVFGEEEYIPVYDAANNRAECICANARTVIIERSMLDDEKQKHRYRFTLAHESCHWLLHEPYFINQPKQYAFARTEKMVKNKGEWTDQRRVEWQADALGAAILMPEKTVRMLADRIEKLKRLVP